MRTVTYACAKCGKRSPKKRCPEHRRKENRPNSRQRGYTAAWERERKRYLTAYPWCACGCGARATDVHHIDGLGPDGPRGFDWDNLEALAHGCHSARTAAEQPAGWNA